MRSQQLRIYKTPLVKRGNDHKYHNDAFKLNIYKIYSLSINIEMYVCAMITWPIIFYIFLCVCTYMCIYNLFILFT